MCVRAASGGDRGQLHCESWRGERGERGRALASHRYLCSPLALPTTSLSGAHSMKDLPLSVCLSADLLKLLQRSVAVLSHSIYAAFFPLFNEMCALLDFKQ